MTTSGPTPRARRSNRGAVVVAFVLGAVVAAVAGALLFLLRPDVLPRRAPAAPAPTVTVTATPSPPPDVTRVTVDVPDSCVRALEGAGNTATALRDITQAVQSLQFTKAREILERLQRENPQQLVGLTQECREAIDKARLQGAPTEPAPPAPPAP